MANEKGAAKHTSTLIERTDSALSEFAQRLEAIASTVRQTRGLLLTDTGEIERDCIAEGLEGLGTEFPFDEYEVPTPKMWREEGVWCVGWPAFYRLGRTQEEAIDRLRDRLLDEVTRMSRRDLAVKVSEDDATEESGEDGEA